MRELLSSTPHLIPPRLGRALRQAVLLHFPFTVWRYSQFFITGIFTIGVFDLPLSLAWLPTRCREHSSQAPFNSSWLSSPCQSDPSGFTTRLQLLHLYAKVG